MDKVVRAVSCILVIILSSQCDFIRTFIDTQNAIIKHVNICVVVIMFARRHFQYFFKHLCVMVCMKFVV